MVLSIVDAVTTGPITATYVILNLCMLQSQMQQCAYLLTLCHMWNYRSFKLDLMVQGRMGLLP